MFTPLDVRSLGAVKRLIARQPINWAHTRKSLGCCLELNFSLCESRIPAAKMTKGR
jgi:hypothetical protein